MLTATSLDTIQAALADILQPSSTRIEAQSSLLRTTNDTSSNFSMISSTIATLASQHHNQCCNL
jgi:hypothetical protein